MKFERSFIKCSYHLRNFEMHTINDNSFNVNYSSWLMIRVETWLSPMIHGGTGVSISPRHYKCAKWYCWSNLLKVKFGLGLFEFKLSYWVKFKACIKFGFYLGLGFKYLNSIRIIICKPFFIWYLTTNTSIKSISVWVGVRDFEFPMSEIFYFEYIYIYIFHNA